MSVKMFEVGGCVRDELLGVRSKDIDFAVEAESFAAMRAFLLSHGFTVFLETPEFLTIRARFPKRWDHGMPRFGPFENPSEAAKVTADFVLCRKDGAYSDGRRPDTVEPGTILDDLARRDFTVNAIAKDPDGVLIDPFGGVEDLRRGTLRAVGSAEARLREDSLRALRAVRFMVTKGFALDRELNAALHSAWLPELLENVSAERRREELDKAFRHDTLTTLTLLANLGPRFREAVFADGLRLKPTLEK